MYSNTAYEALYKQIGLQFPKEVIHRITSQVIFRAALLLIFGVAFFTFLVHFASCYIPFFLRSRRAPIGSVVVLVFCLFLGISLPKVDGSVTRDDIYHLFKHSSPSVTARYIHDDTERVGEVAKVVRLFPLAVTG